MRGMVDSSVMIQTVIRLPLYVPRSEATSQSFSLTCLSGKFFCFGKLSSERDLLGGSGPLSCRSMGDIRQSTVLKGSEWGQVWAGSGC